MGTAVKIAPLSREEFKRIADDIGEELAQAAQVKPVDVSPRLFLVEAGPGADLTILTVGGLCSPTDEPDLLALHMIAAGNAFRHMRIPILGAYLLYEEAGRLWIVGKTPAGLWIEGHVAYPKKRIAGLIVDRPVDRSDLLDLIFIAGDPDREEEAIRLLGETYAALLPKDGEPPRVTEDTVAQFGARAKPQPFRTYARKGAA